jgi:lipid A ethanolaminephosphotransferase
MNVMGLKWLKAKVLAGGNHPWAVSALLALWLSTIGNAPFWWALSQLPEMSGLRAWLGVAGLWLALTLFMWAFVNAVVWPWWRRTLGLVLLTVTTVTSYFMALYGVVIDPTMIANALNTNVTEARDLASFTLAGLLLVGVGLPGLWWWHAQPRSTVGWQRWTHQLGAVLLGAALAAAVLVLVFQDLASIMRTH